MTWLGHSAFLIEGRDKILVDPFIQGNPKAPCTPEEIDCDVVCVTHAHEDHVGDSVSISKRNSAPIVAIYEISIYAENKGAQAIGINIGGSTQVRNTRITMTQAVHSSCFAVPGGVEAGGSPAGFVIDSGRKVYHAGDTALFGDMRFISELYQPEVAMLPIGDYYTMGPVEATKAAGLLRSRFVIPMHYNTFPMIQQDPEKFKQSVESETESKVFILEPGKEWSIP